MTDENTMLELDNILNDLEPDVSRLRLFLNQKKSRKPKNNQQFLLAVPDISFDIGVDLVRHTPKQSAEARKQPSCDPVEQDRVAESQPQHENGKPFSVPVQRSLSSSPSMARRTVGGSPLKKCTRITVLKNSNDECDSTPSPMSFEPVVSSTPALVSKPSEKQTPKDAIPTSAKEKNEQALTAQDFENSFLRYMMKTKSINNLPLSPPNKSQKNSRACEQDMRRTFNSEKETESSHLKATQKKKKKMRGSHPVVRLKRISLLLQESVIETAMELNKLSGTEQQDLCHSAAVPDPVSVLQDKPVPATSPPATSLPALSAALSPAISHASPATSKASSSVLPKTSRASPSVLLPEPKEELVPEAPGSELRLTDVVSAPPKPTPTSPAPSASCGIQTSFFLPDAPHLKEGAESLVAINLEPPGGGKAAKQQLQTQTVNESGSDDDELVLDLHNYRHRNLARAMTNKERRKAVLNKPSHPEINGQQFAKELEKMSNYEIIDLRKRNSRGLLNGQLFEDKQIVEKKINQSILRRKSEANDTSCHNNSKRQNRRRPELMTQELRDYLKLSRTIELRVKNSTSSYSKRRLYTKGDSDNEMSSPSPEKQARLCDSGIHIASSPPSVSPCIDDVTIAPAPPVSMRFSQQISTKENTSITFQKEPTVSLKIPSTTPCIDSLPIVPPPPVSLRFSQSSKVGCDFGNVSEEAVVYLEKPVAYLEDSLVATCIDALPIVKPTSVSSNHNSGKDVPDQLNTNALVEAELPIEENNVRAENQSISEHMEPLRVQSISPPPLDDQPSTSHAARAALESSLIKKTKLKKTKEKTSKDDAFKPPYSSHVPRAKKKKKEEDYNITIRKSKRGHMPLRNDFCHTLSDPFSFMRVTYSGSAGDRKTLKRKRNDSNHKQVKKPVKEQAAVIQHKKKTVPTQATPDQQVMEPQQVAVMEPEQVKEQQPQNDISPVFSWLRGVSNIPPKSMNQVSIKCDSMSISPAADLNFISLENIDYAFYLTEKTCTLGYMRLQPFQQRGFKRNKTNSLNFIVIYGKFGIEVQKAESDSERYFINSGDMVEIKKGCRFNIVNRLNEVGLLLVNRSRESPELNLDK